MASTSATTRWSEIVSDLELSGMSAKDYAHANGVNASTLAWWRWRLRREATTPAVPAFVEVEVHPVAEPSPVRVILHRWDAELVIDASVPAARVRELVDALC